MKGNKHRLVSVNVKSFYIGVFVAASLFAVTSSVSAGTEHNLSGFGWSGTIGWISFDRAETGNPPNSDINSGTGSIAKVNFGSGAVNGWARALSPVSGSNFWDGWI